MSLTTNQSYVLDTLKKARQPLGAYEVLERLRNVGLTAPMQVYRALEILSKKGLVHRLESINAYVCCNQPEGCGSELRGFAICDDCGQIEEFSDEKLNQFLAQWISQNAFSMRQSAIEIRGLCVVCVNKKSNSK